MGYILDKLSSKADAMKWINKSYNQKLVTYLYALMLIVSLGVPLKFKGESFAYVVLTDAIITGIIILLSLGKTSFEGKRYKKRYLILILMVGGSFLVNGLYFGVTGYIAVAGCVMVIMPMLHFTVGDYGANLESMAKGCLLTFALFIIITIISGPALRTNQYSSFFGNPNILGNFMMITVPSILFLLVNSYGRDRRETWALRFALGIAIALCFFSNSRTSFLAIILQVVFYCVFIALNWQNANTEERWKKTFKVGVRSILILTLATGILFVSLTYIKSEVAEIAPNIQIDVEDDADQITIEKSLSTSIGRFEKGLTGSNKGSSDAFTSGRMGIWAEYLRHLKLMGHREEAREIIQKDRYYKSTNAHNAYIQVAYSAGIIAGIGMLMLPFLLFIDSIKVLYKGWKEKKLEKEHFFVMSLMGGFVVASITSGGYMMFTYLPATFFWISIGYYTVYRKAGNQ